MSKTAIYLRVSTLGQSLKSQRAEVDRWLQGHGIDDARVFTDKSTATISTGLGSLPFKRQSSMAK